MEILDKVITHGELKDMAAGAYGNFIKAVVDVARELVAVDAELHSDLESLLLESGSKQKSLWGINFYPDAEGDDFVEFDSMINMRPSQENMTRGVDDETVRQRIIEIVNKWIQK